MFFLFLFFFFNFFFFFIYFFSFLFFLLFNLLLFICCPMNHCQFIFLVLFLFWHRISFWNNFSSNFRSYWSLNYLLSHFLFFNCHFFFWLNNEIINIQVFIHFNNFVGFLNLNLRRFYNFLNFMFDFFFKFIFLNLRSSLINKRFSFNF